MSIGIVQTKYGKVSGVEADEPKYREVTFFKGIPYAAPPVGSLRWKAPQDPQSWEGVRKCETFAPRPAQMVATGLAFEPFSSDFYYMGNPPMSEDCLYLNVATAARTAGEKRPVFVWYHGGGLSSGYSYEIQFDPNELAKKGIVAVFVGQRLNIFGYMALPQLSAEQGGKSGNYGLMDEVKALDWVYENIAAFGGVPENITIGGQSGGTAKSGSLAATPANKGYVKRVINQSGLYWLSPRGGLMLNRCFGEYRAVGFPKSKTYPYLFSHLTPSDASEIGTVRDPGRLLAWHASELWYTFASLRDGRPPIRPWKELDYKLADQISSYWANFIKTGDPNDGELPYWPPSDENLGWMELGDELNGHAGLENAIDKMIYEYVMTNIELPNK